MTADPISNVVPTYAEDRCAQRWPLSVLGIGMPLLTILFTVIGVVLNGTGLIILDTVTVFLWIFTDARLVFQYWPTGIRIDGVGIRIGGVRRAERHREDQSRKPKKPAAPMSQAYQVFSVPWAGVQSLTVVTDRKELRRLRKESLRGSAGGVRRRGPGEVIGVQLGMMVPPFLRAALVFDVDPGLAHVPEFRLVQSATGVSTSQEGTRSSTWVVPTRRPDQLRATVEAITNSEVWNARSR